MRTGDIGIMGRGRLHAHRGPQEGYDPGQRLQRLSQRARAGGGAVPGVLECAAVGVPDEAQGEAIKIFVVRSDPALTEDEVAPLPRPADRLQAPRYIEFRDELPKTNVGRYCGANCAPTPEILLSI